MTKSSTFGQNFTITYRLKSAPKISGALFKRIKEKILAKNYNLSLVLISAAYSQKLNGIYRHKNKAANILSFALEKNVGEIFISSIVKKGEVTSMFIHGLCHLKGMTHGSRMESEEKKYRKLFNIQ